MTKLKTLLCPILLLLTLAACAVQPGAGPGSGPGATADLGLDGTLRLARAALAGGDVDNGINLLRQAANAHPRSIEVKRALADAYYEVQAFPEAAKAYAALSEAQPASPEGALGLGRVALAQGDAAQAIQRFQAALALQAGDGPALNGMAVAYDYAGRHAEAQAIYRQLLAKDPADRAVANNLALSQALDGDLKQAIAGLSTIADGPTRLPQARYNLALAYAMNGNSDAAQDILSRDLDRRAVAENLAFYRTLAPAARPVTSR